MLSLTSVAVISQGLRRLAVNTIVDLEGCLRHEGQRVTSNDGLTTRKTRGNFEGQKGGLLQKGYVKKSLVAHLSGFIFSLRF